MDVPDVALDMMRIFMYGKSFESVEQDLDRSQAEPGDDCPVCPTCPDPPDKTDTATHALHPTDDDEGYKQEDSNSMMQYVVAHSWLGAILAVCVFVGAFLYVRRRQQRSQTISETTSYGNLEMKGPRHYRDRPEESFDDEEDSVETNGNGII